MHRPTLARAGALALIPRLALLIVVVAPVVVAGAPSSSAMLNEALDKQVDLQLNGSLPDAMLAIEKKTFVPMRAEAGVWELLPWGEQTSVTATIKNQTLRQALGALTQKLGLTFILGEEA